MKIFYEKRGKRYYPVKEYDDDLFRALSEGSYLVSVIPGVRSTKYVKLETKEEFEILATLIKYEKELLDLLKKEDTMTPTLSPLTKKQKEAWKKLEDSFGGAVCSLRGKSWQEIIDKFNLTIVEKIKKDKKNLLLLEEVIE